MCERDTHTENGRKEEGRGEARRGEARSEEEKRGDYSLVLSVLIHPSPNHFLCHWMMSV